MTNPRAATSCDSPGLATERASSVNTNKDRPACFAHVHTMLLRRTFHLATEEFVADGYCCLLMLKGYSSRSTVFGLHHMKQVRPK